MSSEFHSPKQRTRRVQVCPDCDGFAQAVTRPHRELVILACPACAGSGEVRQ
ncbi:MAG: hypothetical protein ACRDPK_12590 [Carbonactinosporaceae bacterium]